MLTGRSTRCVCVYAYGCHAQSEHSAGPWRFDRVLDVPTTNEEVYEQSVASGVADCLDGTNFTAICYGQSGTGKSHTALGGPDDPVRYMLRRISLAALLSHSHLTLITPSWEGGRSAPCMRSLPKPFGVTLLAGGFAGNLTIGYVRAHMLRRIVSCHVAPMG